MIRNISILATLALLVTTFSCGDDDSPTPPPVVDDDTANPVVTINAPANGSTISTTDATTTVTIDFTATDNVELASVAVDFDGSTVLEVSSFTDFQNYVGNVNQADVGDGSHTVTVTATDQAGNTGTSSSTFTKETANPYTPLANEVFYMPFEGDYLELVSEAEATIVGSPEFAGSGYESEDAYAGATDAFLTTGTTSLQTTEMTASFYYKIRLNDPEPEYGARAGILVMGPEDTENEAFPDTQNLRTSGFRFFREGDAESQIFKLNFGTGEGEVWLDGGDLARLETSSTDWHHFALVIDATTAAVYIDGGLVAENVEHTGMDISGTDLLAIGSGGPRFNGWNHRSDHGMIDELRIFNTALSEADLESLTGLEFGEIEFNPDPGLTPIEGADAVELMRVSFDSDFSATGTVTPEVTVVGNPTVADAAYVGAADSYITMPSADLAKDEFSASFWINVNNEPNRAGLLVIGPEDSANESFPDVQNLRTHGLRFFREDGGGDQRFKLNVGNGTADTWIDGGDFADIPADVTDWRHVAFTVTGTSAQVYLNGILVAQNAEMTGLDWTGCDLISFGSGAPRFTEWGHLADESSLDDLRIYEGVLTQAQVTALMAAGR
ncbi:MAG: LamG-like jellyroll fold domain-containing protein [Cyclobacteriaceae bacterium]